MSKKDYVAIAEMIAAFREKLGADEGGVVTMDRELVVPLAHMLKADNEAFDYARFLAACGVRAE